MRANELEIAILGMVKESLRRGNIEEWLDLGWTKEDLSSLSDISITELKCSARAPTGRLYASLRPNRDWIEEYAATNQEDSSSHEVACELIAYGAPYPTVNELLQIGKRKWRTVRLVYESKKPVGRADFRRVRSEDDSTAIVDLLNDFRSHSEGSSTNDRVEVARAILFVTKHLGYSVAEVHRVWKIANAKGGIDWDVSVS